MKYCGSCGIPLQEDWRACPRCGAVCEEDVVPVQKPKQRVWLIVLCIVLSVLLMCGSVVPLTIWLFHRRGNEQEPKADAPYADREAVLTAVEDDTSTAYTEGRVENGVYINEWLGITFDLSNSFPQYSAQDQKQYESRYNDCGYASISRDKSQQFVLLFEDMTVSESAYTTAEECARQTYESMVGTYGERAVGRPTKESIGGHVYEMIRVDLGDMVQYIAMAKQDETMVMFIAFSDSDEQILHAFESIEPLVE